MPTKVQTHFVPCLLLLATDLQVAALNEETISNAATQLRLRQKAWEAEVYHPGHVAEHVTRLLRYDKSEHESLLQAEAAWKVRERSWAEDGAEPVSQIEEEAEEEFLQLPAARIDHLRRKHRSWLEEGLQEIDRPRNHRARLQQRSEGKFQFHSRPRQGIQTQQGADGNRTLPVARVSPTGQLTDLLSDSLQRERRAHRGRRDVHLMTVLEQVGSQYVGPIGVGTTVNAGCGSIAPSVSGSGSQSGLQKSSCEARAQSTLFVVWDSGSTNLWCASDLCDRGSCVKQGRARYNHTASLTYKQPDDGLDLRIKFGTGAIEGTQAVDDFHIGPFTVSGQVFGMIRSQSGSVFEEVPFEGILGLAFPSMSANNVRPFFDTVIQEQALAHNEFGFYFSRTDPTANAVLWGGVDERFYEPPIEFFKVVDPYYWSLHLESFLIGDEVLFGHGGIAGDQPIEGISESTGLAEVGIGTKGRLRVTPRGHGHRSHRSRPRSGGYSIIDTGTTYFSAESGLFEEVMSRLPSAPCKDVTEKSHPKIRYRLRGVGGPREFVFSNRAYMAKSGPEGQEHCTTAFMKLDIPSEHGPAMVFGEVFLRHFFTVFDRGPSGDPSEGKIGFARSKQGQVPAEYLRRKTQSQPSFFDERSDSRRAESDEPDGLDEVAATSALAAGAKGSTEDEDGVEMRTSFSVDGASPVGAGGGMAAPITKRSLG